MLREEILFLQVFVDHVHESLEDLVTDADDKLLNHILYSKHHVLHSILPGRSDFN